MAYVPPDQLPVAQLLQPIKRWTPGRKDALLLAVVKGELSAEKAREVHGISEAEWDDWIERFRYGRGGQKVTLPRPAFDSFGRTTRR